MTRLPSHWRRGLASVLLWAAVAALAAYVAPHAVEHVRTSPAFQAPAR